MDLGLSGEQADTQELIRRLLADAGPAAARAAEPLGFDPVLWKRLATSGICGMGLPDGGDAGLDLLIVVAEALGRSLAPVPVIEHTVAGRLLARLAPESPHLADIVSGDAICTLGLAPAVGGRARLVPAGAVADIALVLEGDELIALVGQPGAAAANLADAPVADRRRTPDDAVVASGEPARLAYDDAVDEWRVLTAGALVGVGQGAFDLTLDYVKQRHQFGRPIGSFQALQHGLAELVPMLDGGRLLTHEAAWALQTGERSQRGASGPELAVMALCFTGETAREVSARAIQYHGGYGYALEQDAQLYYRRSRGWSLAIGSVAGELTVLADRTWGAA